MKEAMCEPLNDIDPQALGARLREAREACGWTQQEAADQMEVASPTMVAIEKGERRLNPVEFVRLAELYGQSNSELLQPVTQLLGLEPSLTVDGQLHPHFIAFAVEAWQRGDLSEGQLARLLRTDRLGAREIVARHTTP